MSNNVPIQEENIPKYAITINEKGWIALETYDDSLDWLQKHVDGYIEIVNLTDGFAMVINDNGKALYQEMNVPATLLYGHLPNDYITGPAVVVKAAGPELIGLTGREVAMLFKYLAEPLKTPELDEDNE